LPLTKCEEDAWNSYLEKEEEFTTKKISERMRLKVEGKRKKLIRQFNC